jgi:hypothetical protein
MNITWTVHKQSEKIQYILLHSNQLRDTQHTYKICLGILISLSTEHKTLQFKTQACEAKYAVLCNSVRKHHLLVLIP